MSFSRIPYTVLSLCLLFSFSLSEKPLAAQSFSSIKAIHEYLKGKDQLPGQEADKLLTKLKAMHKQGKVTGDHRAKIQYLEPGQGGYVLWFLKAKTGDRIAIQAERNRSWSMLELGQSGYFVASEKFPNGTSVHYRYDINGRRLRHHKTNRFGFEHFPLGSMSQKQAGVPAGDLIDMGMHTSSKFYPGATRNWQVYIPQQYAKRKAENKPVHLMVFNDGKAYAKGDGNACIVMDNLIHAGKMPVTIGVFINPGEMKNAQSKVFRNRSNEYDTCTAKYATFVEEEILTPLYEKYLISKDPNERCIVGASSGASCAFTAAWHRNDLYGKVISTIGSYCDFRQVNDYPDYLRGESSAARSEYGPFKTAHDYPAMIRKFPKKNIRIYLQDGTNDLDNTLGNWFENNERMALALAFSGYDYKFVIGNGRHSRKHEKALLPEAMAWIWRK